MAARITSGHDDSGGGMEQDHAARRAIRKASRRLLPFLGLCYAVNFLDRVNVGFAALAVNLACFGLLWSHRAGDANMRSAWLCSRNDALGNIAVLGAASGVFVTAAGWPDILVAAIMAALALWSSVQVLRHARDELRQEARILAT